MGFWDFLTRKDSVSIAAMTPNVTYVGGSDIADLPALLDPSLLSVTQLWQSQPHLRTVVSFLARNVAQLGVHTFQREGDSRVRDRTSVFSSLVRRPNPDQTAYDLVYSLVGDLALYDRAYWLLGVDSSAPSGWVLRRLPPSWVTPSKWNAFAVSEWQVVVQGGDPMRISADDIIAFGGYHPSSARDASPTIETLRQTLQEQVEAAKFRAQIWKRGGRVSSVLQRPAGSPEWSDAARESFRQDWYSKYTGNGSMAGGTPILEDGMTLQRIDFTAAEQQWVEAAKLALSTVASAFHINPTMVGVLDNANYSNVREFRRMLYGDSLGPLIAQIEDRINTFVLPKLGMDNSRFYVEFNIAEKLQGSFEEQAAVMSTLVGRPIMTADEGRALFNRPALGGDAGQLVTPLNVLIGGQASPRDSGSQNQNSSRALTKARAPETFEERHAEVVAKFFRRQASVVKSLLGAKAGEEFWDAERWDTELSDDLFKLAVLVSRQVSAEALKAIGYPPDDYDVDRTLAWLREASDRSAKSINEVTLSQVEDALASDDPTSAVASVFDVAEGQRSGAIAATAVTMLSAWATVEAANQVVGDKATKTWVTGPKARPSHAAMNGETVALSENFSNGLPWPGAAGDPDEVAGCNCSLSINTP